MLRPLLNSLLALILAVTPVAAQEFMVNGGGLQGGRPAPSVRTLFRATCAADVSNTNIYTYNPVWPSTIDETWPGIIVAITLAEDALTNFGVSQVNNGHMIFSEDVDEDGTGVVNTQASHSPTYTQAGNGHPSVVVAYSESVTAATVCTWFITGFSGPVVVDSSVADDDAAGGALVLTTGTTNSSGFVMGGCTSSDSTGPPTTTWAVLTERTDTSPGEYTYSNADASGTGASMSNTCDWTGTVNNSGVAIAIH